MDQFRTDLNEVASNGSSDSGIVTDPDYLERQNSCQSPTEVATNEQTLKSFQERPLEASQCQNTNMRLNFRGSAGNRSDICHVKQTGAKLKNEYHQRIPCSKNAVISTPPPKFQNPGKNIYSTVSNDSVFYSLPKHKTIESNKGLKAADTCPPNISESCSAHKVTISGRKSRLPSYEEFKWLQSSRLTPEPREEPSSCSLTISSRSSSKTVRESKPKIFVKSKSSSVENSSVENSGTKNNSRVREWLSKNSSNASTRINVNFELTEINPTQSPRVLKSADVILSPKFLDVKRKARYPNLSFSSLSLNNKSPQIKCSNKHSTSSASQYSSQSNRVVTSSPPSSCSSKKSTFTNNKKKLTIFSILATSDNRFDGSVATPTSCKITPHDLESISENGVCNSITRDQTSSPRFKNNYANSNSFEAHSFPRPNKNVFNKIKQVLSAKPRSNSISTELVSRSPLRCRRRLFTEEIANTETSAQIRYITNQVLHTDSPDSTTVRSCMRSPSATPSKDLKVHFPDVDAIQEQTRTILSNFLSTSKVRMQQLIQKLDDENNPAVLTRRLFDETHKCHVMACQVLLKSFTELSLNLLTGKGNHVELQNVYLKNSEEYVGNLVEFGKRSHDVIQVIYSVTIRREFHLMSRVVILEGMKFLECSYFCVEVPRKGSDEVFKNVNDQFNAFSSTFERMIRWTRMLNYDETISIVL